MFGYSNFKEKSYKSKVSFSNAVVNEKTNEAAERKVILAEPKPSSYWDYLQIDPDSPKIYNDDGFKLRGTKQYWLHEELVPEEEVRHERAASTLHPLDKNTEFVGRVRFQNLRPDELGLLLWAIRLNQNSQVNIGKAKAYGYGRCKIEILKARQIDVEQAYDSSPVLDPWKDIDVQEMIAGYKQEINKNLKGKHIDELEHVTAFFQMKDASRIPANTSTKYMSIDRREYQNRQGPLPSVEEVAR
jgi:CRISPR-associated protein (TIGR03986 family)